MKELQTCVSHIQDTPGLHVVSAVTWYNAQPDFSTHGMTIPYMKQVLLSVVFTHAENLKTAVNAAAQRTVEKLFIRRILIPGKERTPQIELLVRPALKNENFVLPHCPKAQHWLLNAADRALDAWLKGER
jgi:hypothetical protein